MTNPIITIHDAFTNQTIVREMTEEEYAELLATGWTLEPVVEPVLDESTDSLNVDG